MRCVACNDPLDETVTDPRKELCNYCLEPIKDAIPYFNPASDSQDNYESL